MTPSKVVLRRIFRFALAGAAIGLLAACDDRGTSLSGRALSPIPNDTLALMEKKGVTQDSPVLLRAYKQEAELEVWKQRPDGTYVYLKTFPMCRWSGQLGPKLREGDRQVPEGFYSIGPGQMNPNSHYYLSFNVGYPNAYDRAHGASGGNIMVHGVCSSAGCFSMTNEQMGEIYAIAREAFNGGQREIQLQSFPFKMTPENLAKYRLDPHIAFWKMLKEGADNFEVSKREPKVGVCGRHYVFNVTPADGQRLDASEPCPKLIGDDDLKAQVAEKEQQDDQQVAALVAKGVKAVEVVYEDGGQNPVFANKKIDDVSDPDALAHGPTEIVLDDRGKPTKPKATVIASAAGVGGLLSAGPAPAGTPANAAMAEQPFYKRWLGLAPDTQPTSTIAVVEPAAPKPANVPLPPRRPMNSSVIAGAGEISVGAAAGAAAPSAPAPAAEPVPFYKRWLGLGSDTPQTSSVPASEPEVPQPADVPLPPPRQAAAAPDKPQASLLPTLAAFSALAPAAQ